MTEPLLDPDRILALSYVPAAARPAIETLWRLDAAMGEVLASASQPMVSRIKLAWWREALEALDRGAPPPEPVLQGVAAKLLPHGVSGAELAALEEGWAILATEEPLGTVEIDHFAAARGGALFRLSARLLEGSGVDVERGGEAWALVDLARRSRNEGEAAVALAAASTRIEGPVRGWPSRLRPLGMLVMLARRDVGRQGGFEPRGAPARMVRMLRHRLTGR